MDMQLAEKERSPSWLQLEKHLSAAPSSRFIENPWPWSAASYDTLARPVTLPPGGRSVRNTLRCLASFCIGQSVGIHPAQQTLVSPMIPVTALHEIESLRQAPPQVRLSVARLRNLERG